MREEEEESRNLGSKVGMPASLTLSYFFTVKLFCTSLSQLSTYTIKCLHLFTDFCKNATDPTSCFHSFVTHETQPALLQLYSYLYVSQLYYYKFVLISLCIFLVICYFLFDITPLPPTISKPK